MHRRAIALLNADFVQSAVLAFPDPTKECIIHIDASDSAVGTTMSQEDLAGCVKLITCMSKKLNSAEKNYPTNEREFVTLLQALRNWRHYVLGSHVVAHTDNVALRHYKTAPNLSTQMVRWLGDIEQYDLTLKHIPGATNTAADALPQLCPMTLSVDADTWLAE